MNAYKKFKCSFEDHEKPVLFGCIKNSPSKLFPCVNCLIDKPIDNTQLVELSECINQDKSNFIYNWPPGINSEISSLLEKKGMIKELQDKLLTQANQKFDILISSTTHQIEAARKKALVKIEKQYSLFGYNSVIDEYNKVSKRDDLMENLLNQSNKKIAAFFAEMIKQKEKNSEALKQLAKNDVSFDSDQIDKIITTITGILEELDAVQMKGFWENQLECSFIKQPDNYSGDQFYVFQKDRLSHTIIQNNKVGGSVYSDLILDEKKKYIVRLKFNHPFQKQDYNIGIGSKEIEGQKRISSHRISNQGKDRIDKSLSSYWLCDELWEHKDSVFNIEMRVCIQKNILIFSDYQNSRASNYKKTKVQQNILFKNDEQLRIYISMNYDSLLDKTIIVESVKEVTEFPPIKYQ